jgi:glycosyltransferase involved in cell wall biosynthesis
VTRIGVVVQRYGREVLGGAETLAREVAERLAGRGFDVTVYTTTALEYTTWANHFRSGESVLRGVRIRRYPVAVGRDMARFNALSEEFFAQAPESRSEEPWIVEQGPFAPELLTALQADPDDVALFLFFTYLYYPTVVGLPLVGKPALLFPTAHDEPPLHLRMMQELFRRPRAIFCLTEAELELVRRVFSPPGSLELVRSGVELRDDSDEGLFRSRYRLPAPFLLYAGRIEPGKGLEEAINYYRELRRRQFIDLVLIGRKTMEIPADDGLKYAGFVSEAEKRSAFKGALLSLQPSRLESLSISTLESFAAGTPVLVNRHCPALLEHVERSGGGLAYGDAAEFVAAVERLYQRPALRRLMGKKGRDYVRRNYSWETVMDRIVAAIRKFGGVEERT